MASQRGLSIRTQVVGLVAVLVITALTLAGASVYMVESSRIVREVANDSTLTMQQFDSLAERSSYRSAEQLIGDFIAQAAPRDEQRFGMWQAGGWQEVPGLARDPILTDDTILSTARQLSTTGGREVVRTSRGQTLVAVKPVRLNNAAAFVVVTPMAAAESQLADTMRLYAAISAAAAIIICAIAAWQANAILAPLRRLNDTARRISDADLSQRLAKSSNDEIGQLTSTFNDMLDRLDGAFRSQRQLLDDAGHELRTPLTIMRGHLEVLDPGDPAEVAETNALLTEEIDRMTRLVEDLILLSKADTPGFLHPEPIRLASWIGGVRAKASALGPREWNLSIVQDGQFWGDSQRLTQALLQLADNAVKHSDPGTVIELGGEVGAEQTRLWVSDQGDGVPLHLRQEIFDRFRRGELRPGDEGSGLGLSIVGAIAEAHQGWVTVADELPRGSRFILTFPTQEQAWPES